MATTHQRPSLAALIAIALLGAAAAGVLWWWLLMPDPEPKTPLPQQGAPPGAQEETSVDSIGFNKGPGEGQAYRQPSNALVEPAGSREKIPGHDVGGPDADPRGIPMEASDTPDGIGPRRWMAEAHDIDVEALESRLEASRMEQAFVIAERRDHRRARDEVEDRVAHCYATVAGHQEVQIALIFQLSTEAGRGRVEGVEILHYIGEEDPRLIECVLHATKRIEFAAEGDGVSRQVRTIFESH